MFNPITGTVRDGSRYATRNTALTDAQGLAAKIDRVSTSVRNSGTVTP